MLSYHIKLWIAHQKCCADLSEPRRCATPQYQKYDFFVVLRSVLVFLPRLKTARLVKSLCSKHFKCLGSLNSESAVIQGRVQTHGQSVEQMPPAGS